MNSLDKRPPTLDLQRIQDGPSNKRYHKNQIPSVKANFFKEYN